ncbi:oxidoreductase domain protein [Cellulomonas flavigena DSM 20109]|uniref:Oxidoreductase domain protein n=1 Tax=Cellulomonas flavigena (strain ATCC 482 / DSM 20109 / BCRC 11376 / JCM 18109 / NBRC 3775 / NCIMB 8073 / NRS 134) TaxID=446466 RepID=D5UFX6_CELFN|nr:Gfo/Idh/MocA family oxidoreductase [Cellulomonas flavigena]ADG74999.1 oxidoreductase domain protein [Cellulomonas flavigena DSM 20109]
MEALRIGLIGYGAAGRGIHARLARETGQEVVTVVTRTRDEQVRADWPAARVVPTVDALLAGADGLDLVVVASPTGEHAAHVRAALEADVAVLVDKPLATTRTQAAALVRLAREHGGRLTVFQNRRWDPEQLTLRALLDAGRLGRVHRFERRWERYRPQPQQRWKEQDPVAGGLLLDLGAHLVDSAVQLFGPVRRVHAELRALTTPALDDVFLALEHVADADGHHVVSHLWGGGLVGAPGPRTRVLGERGAYLVTSYEGEPTPFAVLDDAYTAGRRPGEPEHEGWLVRGTERTPVPRAAGGHADLYRAVQAWIRADGPVPVDPADAVATARVLDAARVASETGVAQLVV